MSGEHTRTRDHLEIREALHRRISAGFETLSPAWNPRTHADADRPDQGRGLVDCYALALHILWTYQHAWSGEQDLRTASLDDSVNSLLAGIGHRPLPGSAAVGLLHLRCRPGLHGVVSRGLQARAKARGERPEVVFETLAPVRVDAALNCLHPFRIAPAGAPLTPRDRGRRGQADPHRRRHRPDRGARRTRLAGLHRWRVRARGPGR